MRAPVRLLGALVGVAVLAGCGSDEEGPPVAERAEEGPEETPEEGPDERAAPIEWAACGSAECASVTVPVDHDDPGATIDLAVLRLPATGDRIGPLFVNFGGPGNGTVEAARSFPWPDEVRERFDIVAVDPRGVGGSAPLDCGVPTEELYAVDHSVEDSADQRVLVEVSEAYAADCGEEAGALLAHLGTRDVAADLDAVRQAMGDERLSFLGYSYGTSIGQAYAERFPERTRAMVLDGIVDPSTDGITTATQQAAGFEVALQRWAAACPDRPTCPGDDPIATVDAALAAAERVLVAGDGRTLNAGQATVGLALALYAESLWPALDQAVADAAAGDGAVLLQLADQYVTLVEFPAYFAVSCLDSTWPAGVDQHLAEAEAAGAASPRFGEALVNDYLRCAVWPVPPDPLGPITAPDAPPLLLVSTTGDPATPHAGALAVADRLDSAVLLTHEGDGHTIALQGDPCVDEVVLSYLVDLALPGPDARC